MTGIESSGGRGIKGEMPWGGFATSGKGEGTCRMAFGASVDVLALYDTPTERCFSACCSARCGLIYLIFRAARELRRMYNRDTAM